VSMYVIIKGEDGKFHCQGRVQDGTERWTEATLDAAVASMKQFARTANHDKIKKKHIQFPQTAQVVKTECVPWDPFGKRKGG